MNHMYHKAILLVTFALAACQNTTPPSWYQQPETNQHDALVGLGEGRTLEQAKQVALNQINAQLWTQIEASFSSHEVAQTRQQQSSSSSLIDNKINSKTANVTFTGIDYQKIEKNDVAYFVEVQISKDNVIAQLNADIRQREQRAKERLEQLQYQDPLLWWLAHHLAVKEADEVTIRQAMLRSLTQQPAPPSPNVSLFVSQLSGVQSSLVIHVDANKREQKMAQMIATELSAQRIKTSQSASSLVTHVLKLQSDLKQSKVDDAYISTRFTTLKLLNRQGNVIASNEIISSGNSLSGYSLSNQGAERHFANLMAKQGIWAFLGFK